MRQATQPCQYSGKHGLLGGPTWMETTLVLQLTETLSPALSSEDSMEVVWMATLTLPQVRHSTTSPLLLVFPNVKVQEKSGEAGKVSRSQFTHPNARGLAETKQGWQCAHSTALEMVT